MKKAWNDVKSFVTVIMTLAYVYLAITNSISQEFLTIYTVIISFYFGTQYQKAVDTKTETEKESE